ncbi:MAG: YncE family protein [Prevotella sp.]|nr:YncE family protein [Prevotella sp.]
MKRYLLLYIAVTAVLAACRTDDPIVYMEDEDTGVRSVNSEVLGLYVLNEGNMGSNKCTLDYLDLSAADSTIHYQRNIYAERNPSEVKELGDVGNDIKIYGSRLWLVINCSNKVEVCRASDAVKIGKVDIPNCRYVAFDGGYAYVSSYVGPVSAGSSAPRGMVYKVDTLSLQKVDSCVVGYQPEELVATGGWLYVANSGGYNYPAYDSTISQINLRTMRVEAEIDVALNLHHLRLDHYGQLWVTSRGDYEQLPSNLYCLRITESGQPIVTHQMDVEVSDLCLVGDSLYFYGVGWNQLTQQNTRQYGIINVRTHQLVSDRLSAAPELDRIRMPYGIVVHPQNRDFYLMDAKNYVSSGELLHFRADGTFDYKVRTGDIPAHATFVFKR